MKNSTRLASLLGTWTGQTHLKADIGSYELLAYFVVHIMPDPMRGNGCSLPDCLEEENRICVLDDNNKPLCQDMAGNVLNWADAVAFMYFGAKIDVGFPFNKHRAEDTGGWIGPLNLILAEGNIQIDLSSVSDGDSTTIVDRYLSRYVETPTTPYLRYPENCTLLAKDDFVRVAGPQAVRNTAEVQYDPNRKNDDDDYDPYEQYYKTCENGDVKPILPLFQFDFVQKNPQNKSDELDESGEDGDDDGDNDGDQESVEVKLNYKLLTMPSKKDFMYNIYPMVQRKFNKADLGFHISGPYCYGDDPNRGYTFDMNFDTRDPKQMINLDHGCIEGLPCVPPAAELYDQAGSSIHVKPSTLPDHTTTIGVGSSIYFALIIIFLTTLLMISGRSNCKLRKELSSIQALDEGDVDYDGGGDDTENGAQEGGNNNGNTSSLSYQSLTDDNAQGSDVDIDEKQSGDEKEDTLSTPLLGGADADTVV